MIIAIYKYIDINNIYINISIRLYINIYDIYLKSKDDLCIYLFLQRTSFLVFQEIWKATKILKSDILKEGTKTSNNEVISIRRPVYLKLDLSVI